MRRRFSLFRRLRDDRRGVAAVEFALWSVLLFMMLVPALDIGLFLIGRSNLGGAVEAAAIKSFSTRDTVDFASIPGYVRASSGIANPNNITVTVGCNGGTGNCINTNASTSTTRTCSCLNANGTLSTVSCSGSCTVGNPGYFMTITASYPYQTVVLPSRRLGLDRVSQSVTVRLQ